MEKPTIEISEINLREGNQIKFEKKQKTIIVGPNNSGKSLFLKEIIRACKNEENNNLLINNINITKTPAPNSPSTPEGTNALSHFMLSKGYKKGGNFYYGDWEVHSSYLRYWNKSYLNDLTECFIKRIGADERLEICKQQDSIAPDDLMKKPQHFMYNDNDITEKVSSLFHHAFGLSLILDFKGGSKIPIHTGDASKLSNIQDRVSSEYIKILREMPLLDEQGDGMRSYAGILFESLITNRDIILIDEPEAFLHPPQMKLLGNTLSSKTDNQLFVATHSSEMLKGFLDGTEGDIKILRIARQGEHTQILEASPEAVRELWQKPRLRYSNALDAIFHEQAIICEDDSDCRLFNAIADHLIQKTDEKWPDTAYIPAGGKGTICHIADALRKIGVPVKAVFDFDFLNNRDLIKRTVEAFGGSWENVENNWKEINDSIAHGKDIKTPEQIKNEISEYLSTEEHDISGSRISKIIKSGNAWQDAKQRGVEVLPHGDVRHAYDNLSKYLQEIGIYIIEKGEIENFHPRSGGHGPKFVTKLLSLDDLSDSSTKDLREFVTTVHLGKASKSL